MFVFSLNRRKGDAPLVSLWYFAPRTISQLIAVRTRANTGIFELRHYFPELRVNKAETNHRTLFALFKNLACGPDCLFIAVSIFLPDAELASLA